MKYFIFMLIIMLSVAIADDKTDADKFGISNMYKYKDFTTSTASKYLDQVVGEKDFIEKKDDITTSSSGAGFFKIETKGSYFNEWNETASTGGSQSIRNIINTLTNLNQGQSSLWANYWTGGETTALINELSSYLNAFPASTEVYDASITNGDTAYVGSWGSVLNPSANDGNSELDDYFEVQHDYSLSFYGGRNTTAGTGGTKAASNLDLELVLTTTAGTRYSVYGYDSTTPIILDMDGNNKLEASNGKWLPHTLAESKVKIKELVEFDINGDGFNEVVEWVGPNDGLLLVYPEDGKVTGKNLFGDAGAFLNGYEKLSVLDVNKDKKITGKELKTLYVWQDRNQNATMESDEVTSVTELGITEINVQHSNLVSYFVQNGENKVMWDWHPVTLMVKKIK